MTLPRHDRYDIRITEICVMPKGQPVFSELTTRISIDDEAAGEFVKVTQEGGHTDVRESVETPDYRVKWQVVFTVKPHPGLVIATCDTFEEAQDEANRFGECLKKLIAAIVQ